MKTKIFRFKKSNLQKFSLPLMQTNSTLPNPPTPSVAIRFRCFSCTLANSSLKLNKFSSSWDKMLNLPEIFLWRRGRFMNDPGQSLLVSIVLLQSLQIAYQFQEGLSEKRIFRLPSWLMKWRFCFLSYFYFETIK